MFYYYLIIISYNYGDCKCLLTTLKVTFVCATAPISFALEVSLRFLVFFYAFLRITPGNLYIKI